MALSEESDEEYLDDPIRIIDFELESFENTASENDPTEKFIDNDLYVQRATNNNVPLKLSTRKVHFTLPVEKTRNVNLSSVCKPLSIKLVKCDFWYPEKALNNDSDTAKEVHFYNKKSDDKKMIKKEKNVKIRPVVSPYEHLIDSPKSNIVTEKSLLLERKNQSKLQDIVNENKYNSSKVENNTQVDFKMNRGLIGMKVTQWDISLKDVEKTTTKTKSKSSKTFTKAKNQTEKKVCTDTLQDVKKILGKKMESTDKITSLNENVTKMLDMIDKTVKKNGSVAEKLQTAIKKKYGGVQDCIKVPASFDSDSVTENNKIVGKTPDLLVKVYNMEPKITNTSRKMSRDDNDNLSQKSISDLKMRVNKTIDDKTATIKDDVFFSQKKTDQLQILNVDKDEQSNNSSKNQKLKQSDSPSNTKNIKELVKDTDKIKKKTVSQKKSNNIETTISSDIGSNSKFHVVSSKEDNKPHNKSKKSDKTKPKKNKIKDVKSVAKSDKCSPDNNTHKKQNKCIKRQVHKKILSCESHKSTQSGNNNNVEKASNKTMTTINLHKDVAPNSNEYCYKKNQDIEKSAISNGNTVNFLTPGVDSGKSSSVCQATPHQSLSDSTRMENSINSDKNVPVIQKFSNDIKNNSASVEAKAATKAFNAKIIPEQISVDDVPTSLISSQPIIPAIKSGRHSSSDTTSINNQPNGLIKSNIPLNVCPEQKSCSRIIKITRVDPAVDKFIPTNNNCNKISSNFTTFPSHNIFSQNKTCNIPSACTVRTSTITAHPTQTFMSTSDSMSKQNHCSSQPNKSTPSMQKISHLHSVVQQLSQKSSRTQSNREQPPLSIYQQEIQPTSNTLYVSQYTKEDRLPPTCDIAMFKNVPNSTPDLNSQSKSLKSGQLLTPPPYVNLPSAPNPTYSKQHSFLPHSIDPRQQSAPPNPLILGQQLVPLNPPNLRQQLASSNSPIPRQQLAPSNPSILRQQLPPLNVSIPRQPLAPSIPRQQLAPPNLPIRAPHPSDPRKQVRFFNNHLNMNSEMRHNNPQYVGANPQSNIFPFGRDQGFQQGFANLDQPDLHNVHCAPIYDGLPKNVNYANLVLYGMQNNWGGYYNPTMPPPPPYCERFESPEQGSNRKMIPSQETENVPSTPKRISGKTIIGFNDGKVVRKINICEPVDISRKMVNSKTQQLPEQDLSVRKTKDALENNNVCRKQEMIPQSAKTITKSEKINCDKKNKSKPIVNKEITCDKQIVSSKKEMFEELSKLTDESSESPIKGLKRTLSKTANNEEIPKHVDIIKRPKPGPLCSKPRLNTTISPQRVTQTSLAHNGYSPPILPIPTYEELLAKSNMTDTSTDRIGNENETLNTEQEHVHFSQLLEQAHASKVVKNTGTIEEKHDNLAKKICLDKYKKRASKYGDQNELGKNRCGSELTTKAHLGR